MNEETPMATSIVQINDREIEVIEYKEVPIVTFKMVDNLHQRTEGAARKAFNRHKIHLIEGEDFFIVPYDEWKKNIAVQNMDGDMRRQRNPMTFLTESGYLLLVKSFQDDLAWKVQRQLVRAYFTKRQEPKPKPTETRTISTASLDKMTLQLSRLESASKFLTRSEIAALKNEIIKDLPVAAGLKETGRKQKLSKDILLDAISGVNGEFSPQEIAKLSGVDVGYCRKMLNSWANKDRHVVSLRHGVYRQILEGDNPIKSGRKEVSKSNQPF